MKRTGTLAIGACIATFAAGTAYADSESSWYVAPSVYALWLDDERLADDDVGFSLGFGRTINADWDIEFNAFLSQHDSVGNDTLDLKGYQFQTKKVFYRGESRVNPFISVGLGHVTSSMDIANADESLWTATYGVGLLIDLNPKGDDGRGIALRADLGARRALSSGADGGSAPVDYLAGLGLQFSWGATPVRAPVDSDGDGVTDDLDRCPGTPAGTPVDSNGCPLDDDGDGVTNDLDKCPGTPAGAKVDAVGCELDSDGDGVVDSRDQCPNTPPGSTVDEKGCIPDGDGDGIPDGTDKCPDTPKGTRVDNTGCPFNKELLLQGVKFATDSADILPESLPVLEGASATLKRYPEVNIEVAGYTDSRGSDSHNQQLSERRAQAVLKYLKDSGVTNTLTAVGFGEKDPIASNNTEDGRQQNRRVVLHALN
jgi:OmpA-OmpF porin, OOP family